jgi:hypothetical protein
MSIYVHILGFRPPDARWEQMRQVYEGCQRAGVPVPREVEAFFGWGPPDPAGIRVELPVRVWEDPARDQDGYELLVADIPPQVTVVRVSMSY